jgi:hypothetical protein
MSCEIYIVARDTRETHSARTRTKKKGKPPIKETDKMGRSTLTKGYPKSPSNIHYKGRATDPGSFVEEGFNLWQWSHSVLV